MNVFQSGVFKRNAKKLSKQEKLALDDAVKAVIENTDAGVEKVGDLAGVQVYKYKIDRDEVLLAYRMIEGDLMLLAFGQHVNFYRDPKRQG